MFQENLKLFCATRADTIQLADGVLQDQSEFVPAPGKWSPGEVLDHIILAERLYYDKFSTLIELHIRQVQLELRLSLQQTVALFEGNPNLDYRGMLFSHPLMRKNSALEMLRILALHEQRHQKQIRDIFQASAVPSSELTSVSAS